MISFRDLSLRDAEAEIVGAAMDYEHAMKTALETLEVDDFRSEIAADLRRLFYVCAGWYSRGVYDPTTNRERLQESFPDMWVEGIWCPMGASEIYVRELCQAVVQSNRLLDDAVDARERWQRHNPLASSGQVSPSPAPRLSKGPPKKGGFVGGIPI